MAVVGFPRRETPAYMGLQRQVAHKASHSISHIAAFSKDQETCQPWAVQLSHPRDRRGHVGPAQLMPLTATVGTTTCHWNPGTPPDTGIFICLYAINSKVINVLGVLLFEHEE